MLFNRFSNIISIYTLHFYFTKMKHKSKKNVNNNVIKKICVLFFFLNIVLSQDKIELKQAESLSSLEINNETVTSLKGDIILRKVVNYFLETGLSTQANIIKLNFLIMLKFKMEIK